MPLADGTDCGHGMVSQSTCGSVLLYEKNIRVGFSLMKMHILFKLLTDVLVSSVTLFELQS